MPKFEADSFADCATKIEHDGRRALYGIEGRQGASKFYLCRGEGGKTLYPISDRAAANELGMGGFK